MPANAIYFWKRTPFVRIVLPFIAGILLQWYIQLSLFTLSATAIIACLLIFIFSQLSFASQYNYRWMPGIAINIICIVAGAFIVYNKDIRKKPNWIGHNSTNSVAILATLQEPPIEKAKTFKAEASIDAINSKGEWKDAKGNILIYFSKDSSFSGLHYGSQVLFYKQLQEIKNSGNPGGFDYKQYNAFQDIYHQVFLKSTDYVVTKMIGGNAFKNGLFNIRTVVIKELQQYITGGREAGVAEALLIGYRNDLDKELVQAYSNTGVVHIIAISGLHLGMIYGALIFLFRPFRKYRWIKWIKPVIILSVLWIFTALAGGVPSILRSAVMFSFIVLGEAINRKSSIYNTLAASAFVMLCIDPYYLFDVGFQLSYAAVISIIIFSKPVYNWFYIKNKILDFFWKIISVTIAAQVLTLPIIFYAFHQFPNFFLITNCIIVPLSSIILFAELALLTTSFIPVVAKFVGIVTTAMLAFMNNFIQTINNLPFAVYDNIQNNLAETLILYVVIISICYWLLNKRKPALFVGLGAMFVFIVIDAYENFLRRQQQKIIVYNIPQYNAVDFVDGKKYAFVGDTVLLKDDYLNNFFLKPSRTLHRIKPANDIEGLYISSPFVLFQGKRILLLNKSLTFQNASKIAVDVIVVSHNPQLYIAQLAKIFDCKQYVFDASNSIWKINQWKKDCDSLHLRHHSTPDEGAFELNL